MAFVLMWGGIGWYNSQAPSMWMNFLYELGTRTPTTQQIRFRTDLTLDGGSTGSHYYNYGISAQYYVENRGMGSVTIKPAGVMKWDTVTAYHPTSGWYTINVDPGQGDLVIKVVMNTTDSPGNNPRDGWTPGSTYIAQIPIGYTENGAPSNFRSTYGIWNDTNVYLTWSNASIGTNNDVLSQDIFYRVNSGSWSSVNIAPYNYSHTFNISSYAQGSTINFYLRSNPRYGSSKSTSTISTRVNYRPRAPSIIAVNYSTPSSGAPQPSSSSVTLPSPISLDDGGVYGSFNYNLLMRTSDGLTSTSNISTYITALNNNTVYMYPNWTTCVGHTVLISANASDGWSESNYGPSVYTVIGTSMVASSPTIYPANGIINATTQLRIPAVRIDSSYYLYNTTENISIDAQLDGGNWVVVNSQTRSSTASLSSQLTLTNFLSTLFSNLPGLDQLETGTSHTIKIRTRHSINTGARLTATSGELTITYKVPGVRATITQADGSSTFKFPMNNTIPIVEDSIRVRIEILEWDTSATGTYRIQAQLAGVGSWATLQTKTFRNTLDEYVDIKLSDITTTRGEQYRLRLAVDSTVSGTTTTVASPNLQWTTINGQNELDKSLVEYRALPTYEKIEIVPGSERLDMLINNNATNQFESQYNFYWDKDKAYMLEGAYMTFTDKLNNAVTICTEKIEKTLFNNIDNYMLMRTFVTLGDAPTGLLWPVTTLAATGASTTRTTSGARTVQGNLPSNQIGINIYFDICELYRSTATASAPSTSLKSQTIRTASMKEFNPNTICAPDFSSAVIKVERTL